MKKISIIAVLLSYLLVFYSGCDNPVYKYSIKENTDLSNLLVFYYGPSIFGIDTMDFSVKGHIRIDDMDIGGVAKLPSGGIAFTHYGRAGNNSRGSTLYVTDKDCNLLNTYETCYAPMSPTVINNSLLVGSSAGDMFKIYDTDNFNLKREYQFDDLVDAWQITGYDNNAYFGVIPGYGPNGSKYAHIVELNLDTFDTTIICDKSDFFFDTYLSALRQDSLLYIFDILKKDICIYNLRSKSIQITTKLDTHPAIANIQVTNITHPSFYNGFLYSQLGRYDSDGRAISYLVKLNPNTLEYISHKQLDTPKGYSPGSFGFYAGHYLVMQFLRETELQIIFYDRETGNIEHDVTLPGAKYNYR